MNEKIPSFIFETNAIIYSKERPESSIEYFNKRLKDLPNWEPFAITVDDSSVIMWIKGMELKP